MAKLSVIGSSNKFLIPLIFLFALALRLWNLDYSFSNDELSAVMRANENSISDIIDNGVLIDFHPAGIQVFLTYWINIFGNSEIAVRFPFAIFGSIASVFAFIIARKNVGLTPALLTAVALSALEFSLLHGQLARPYSSGLMLIMIAYWLWNKIIFDNSLSKRELILNSIALAIIFAASAYNHYFSALSSVVLALFGLFFIPKKRIPYYIGTGVLSAILFIPHYSITLYHLSKGSIGSWLAAPKSIFLYTHIIHIFNDSLFLLLSITALVTIYAVLSKKNSRTNLFKVRFILLFLFLAPIIIGYIYSVSIGPVLQNRILLFSMPYILMFIFSFINDDNSKKLAIIPISIVSLIIVHTVFISKYYSTQHFINFNSIAQQCDTTASNDYNILRIQNSNSSSYLKYYLKDPTTDYAIYQLNSEENIRKLKTILDTSNANYCEFVNLRPINNLSKVMINSSFWNIDKYSIDKWQNGYTLYKRSNIWPFITNSTNTLAYRSYTNDTLSIINTEYSEGLKYNSTKNNTLLINIQFEFINYSTDNNSLLVISSNINKSNKRWQSYPLEKFTQGGRRNAFIAKLKYVVSENEDINIYIWNPKKQDIRIINYQLSITNY